MISNIGSGVASIGAQQLEPANPGGKPHAAGAGFADIFKYAVTNLDSLQNSADQQIAQVVQGRANVDIGQVSAAVEKSDVAFQLMMQVRNKVVNAYQDIEKMQF